MRLAVETRGEVSPWVGFAEVAEDLLQREFVDNTELKRRAKSCLLSTLTTGIGWLKLTLQQGSVTALQQACQPVGKLLIQGCVNGLGVEAIAVFNAVSRVDDFAFTPEQSISSGMMTFVSQNRGAKEYGRMRMGLSRGLMVETGYWMLLFCVVLPLRAPIMRLFVGADESAVALGASYLFLMAFFYLLPAYTNGLQGYFRGLGDMKITLAGTFTQISVRVVFVYLLVPRMGLTAVAWASLAGWLCMLLLEVPYLRSMRVRGVG